MTWHDRADFPPVGAVLGGATVVTVVVKIVVNHRRPNSPAIGPRHGLAHVVNHQQQFGVLHATAVSCNTGV